MILVLRDITRALRSPAVIFILILVVGLGFFVTRAASPPFPENPGINRFSLGTAISYTYSDGYHFNALSFDSDGAIVAGANINLTFWPANSSGPSLGSVSGTTNSRGFVALDWGSSPCRCSVQEAVDGTGLSYLPLAFPPSANLTPLGGLVLEVDSGLFLGRPAFLVALANSTGGVLPGSYLSYCAPYSPESPSSCTMRSLGNLKSTVQLFPVQGMGNLIDSDEVQIALIGSDGQAIQSFQIPYSTINPNDSANVAQTQAAADLVSGTETVAFLVALAGVLIGYVSYARDRLNGSLDPVLALPITRTRLILSRYTAAVAACAIGAVVGGLVVDATVSSTTGVALPSSVWVSVIATLVLETIAFVGLAFLGAHLTRSSPLLLVVLVLAAFLFTALWSVVVFGVASAYGGSLDSSSLLPLSPAQASLSIIGWVTYSLDGGPPSLFPTIVNTPLLVLSVAAWTAVPVLLAGWMFRVRD